MLPKSHILIGIIISGLLYFLNIVPLLPVVMIFLSSILIDVDHYLYYIFQEKDVSLKKAYKWYLMRLKKYRKLSNKEKDKHKNFLLIFHGIEPLLIIYILSIYFPVLFWVFIGFIIHLITDLTIAHKDRIFNMKLFLTYQIYRHFKLKRLGIKNPY